MIKNIINEIVTKCLNSYINENVLLKEDHVNIINNMGGMINLIDKFWESPDDVWWVKIEQRAKDAIKYGKRHNIPDKKKNPHMWRSIYDLYPIDGTKRENHIGYAIIRGRTKEECINSLKNLNVHLNSFWAHREGTNVIPSNGNMDALIYICNKYFARAYVSINKRSMKQSIDKARKWKGSDNIKKKPLFRWIDPKTNKIYDRQFHHAVGQIKSGNDGVVDWNKVRPLALVDCDIDDIKAQESLRQLFQNNKCNIYFDGASHDGWHFIIDTHGKDLQNEFNAIAQNYPSQNKPGDPPILQKQDAYEMLYSPIGI